MSCHKLKNKISCNMRKQTFWQVCPTKTPIHLRIHATDQSSLFTWRNFASMATQNASREDSNQTARTCRLIWIFAGACLMIYFPKRFQMMQLRRLIWVSVGTHMSEGTFSQHCGSFTVIISIKRSNSFLPHFRLNKLPTHYILEKLNSNFRYIRLCDLGICWEKWLNYL